VLATALRIHLFKTGEGLLHACISSIFSLIKRVGVVGVGRRRFGIFRVNIHAGYLIWNTSHDLITGVSSLLYNIIILPSPFIDLLIDFNNRNLQLQ
jgi:hypothetical protein